MNCVLIIGGVILYLFIGGFIAGLMDDYDDVLIHMLIWPIVLILALVGYASVALGDWVREQLEDFWKNWRSR